MKRIIIISEQKSFIKRPLSHDAILGQELEFLEYGNNSVEIIYKSLLLKSLNRFITKVGLKPLLDSFVKQKKVDCVFMYIAMHLSYLKANLYLLKELKKSGNQLALYIWDCWEPEFYDWQVVLDDLKPDYVFFSFKQTWEHFKDRYNCYWIPQSANRLYFKNLSLTKTRMFIQMGRVNKPLHEKILLFMKKHSIKDTIDNYAYRNEDRGVLFPELPKLVEEINRSKYLVCIPKCYENQKRTGNISAMTGRYYESIVCKTMIIGKKPMVFDELFPTDGMIEFHDDLSDFEEKIMYFENNPNKYWEIVNKNYDCFMNNHTWAKRLESIISIINK